MASGYGLNGGPSRCFPFWQELLACYVVNASADNPAGKAKCVPALEDYHECLHHKKEYARVKAIQAAYRKKMADNPRDGAPAPGEVRKLGLLDKTPEELNIKTPKWLPTPKSQGAF